MNSGQTIIQLERVDSTNNYLREHPELWGRQFTAVIAREQTGGRGRLSRKWHSEPGRDLTFSTLFRPEAAPGDATVITLGAGLAAYRCLRPLLDGGLNLKWPNDLCYGDKKIGGVLCEMIIDGAVSVVIIGIGINVNSTRFPDDIAATAGSIAAITGRSHDPRVLCEEILEQCARIIPRFRAPLDAGLLNEWIAASSSIGSAVFFIDEGERRSGTIAGINGDGSLRIRLSADEEISGFRGELFYNPEMRK